jgi:hypothetical protein
MTVLPERFTRFAIRDLKEDIERLQDFVDIGNEVSRQAEYKAWLVVLEAYYKENFGDPAKYEEEDHHEMIKKLAASAGLQF